MMNSKLLRNIGSIVVSAMFIGLAAAQTTTTITTATTETEATDLSTTQEIQPEDLGVKKPNFWETFKRKFQKVFTTNKIKDAKLDLELANLTLLKARQAVAAGNTETASTLVDQYNKQVATLGEQVNKISSQLPVDNPQVVALFDQIAQNNLLVASTLDKMSLKATGQFNQKLTKAKLEAVKDIAKVLSKENLSPEKLQEKLTKIADKLVEKEIKAEKKLAKRLAAIEEIDEQEDLEDEDLEDAIKKTREAQLDKIAKDKGIGDIASEIEGSIEKHALVLQEVLKKVPEQAKPAVQKALDRSIEKLREKAKKDIKAINKVIDEDNGDRAEAKEEILKKLKEKDADEKLKKELEKKEERLKKAKEKLGDQEKKKEETKQEAPKTETPAASATTTNGTTTGTTTATETKIEAKTHDVKFKDGKFDISNLPGEGIKVGDSIRFKNDDDDSVQVQSNPHPIHTGLSALNIGVLKKGEEKTVKFEKSGTYGWHNHLNTSVTASVTVK